MIFVLTKIAKLNNLNKKTLAKKISFFMIFLMFVERRFDFGFKVFELSFKC